MMVVTVVLLGVVLVAICHQPAPFIRVSERASADGDDAELDGDNVIRYLLFAGSVVESLWTNEWSPESIGNIANLVCGSSETCNAGGSIRFCCCCCWMVCVARHRKRDAVESGPVRLNCININNGRNRGLCIES